MNYLYSYNLKHAFSLIMHVPILAAEHPTLRLCYRCFSPVRKSLGAVSKSHKLNKLTRKCIYFFDHNSASMERHLPSLT